MKQLVIVGSGPAALTAAIYAARENIETTVYERESMGGLAANIHEVENYPGFPDGIVGSELTSRMRAQAEKFGATIDYGEVSELRVEGDKKILIIDGEEVETRSVLITTGCERAKLSVPGESEMDGRGVHYCATCDGAIYKNRPVIVVGGGNSAVQESIFLTRFTRKIKLLARREITASDVLKKRLKEREENGDILVHLSSDVMEIVSKEGKVVGVRVQDSDKKRLMKADGVFIFVGLVPATKFLVGSGVKMNKYGFIKVDGNLETSVPGVFAAGDVRDGATRQIVCAAGEGAEAAMNISKYLG
jgi:Thioredoxin reductase